MKKKIRISFNAPVILSFVLLCLCATVAGMVTNHASTRLIFSVYRGLDKNVTVRPGAKISGTKEKPYVVKRGKTV